ncbi:uncharacterized protein FSUBG_10470 [Fusarium subglutinans]|uniref:Uncharacterized protein n=1 Tax=Gibberella subglutinans TaxID=42677 RepID=A0A8H5UM27_GIBSU|nr:uncharacterized protein FSUBG_10470 [Fusarium subglutinans]KAF5591544.1 hypothetical protein FSUBG_10470 [Fusarium subglutinans]
MFDLISSPHKRPRRSIAPAKYTSSDSGYPVSSRVSGHKLRVQPTNPISRGGDKTDLLVSVCIPKPGQKERRNFNPNGRRELRDFLIKGQHLKAELKNSDESLSINDLQASGSNWGRRQLLACRVIVTPTAHNVLPAYAEYTQCDERSKLQEIQEIKDFLDGPDPALMHHSTHFLISEYGFSLGETWAALASVKRYPRPRVISSNQGTPEVKRVRRNTALEGYISSAGFQISSSDPEERNSPSAGSDGSGGPSYTEPEPSPGLPAENSTVHLIARVFNHLLYYTQPPKSSPVVDFRHNPQRMNSEMRGLKKQFVAIDDGGLSLKLDEGPVAVALLEAKRRLVVDNGRPKISDECLAQMTCEAILARDRPNLERLKGERTIIINATSHYVCFLEFHLTKTYIDDLNLGQIPSEPLKVVATHWFDLSDTKGRRGVLDNIRGLVGMALDHQL